MPAPDMPSPRRSLTPGAPVLGMVGAGQLARMTAQAAIGLGIGLAILADSPDDSAAQVWAGTRVGDYRSLDDLRAFAAGCDVLTFDHEPVPGDHLAALEQAGVQLRPGPAALRLTQDKLAMRERLTGLRIACPRFAPVTGLTAIEEFAAGSWPVALKAVSGGYDGKGVWVCESAAQAATVLERGAGLTFLVEEYVAFSRELAVLAACSPHRQGAVYPVVQTVQRDGICREVIAPAPGLAPGRAAQAQELGLRIAARPRGPVPPLPLGSPGLAAPATAMANVLGGDDGDIYDRYIHVMAADPVVKVHMYGKPVRPGRKIGQ